MVYVSRGKILEMFWIDDRHEYEQPVIASIIVLVGEGVLVYPRRTAVPPGSVIVWFGYTTRSADLTISWDSDTYKEVQKKVKDNRIFERQSRDLTRGFYDWLSEIDISDFYATTSRSSSLQSLRSRLDQDDLLGTEHSYLSLLSGARASVDLECRAEILHFISVDRPDTHKFTVSVRGSELNDDDDPYVIVTEGATVAY